MGIKMKKVGPRGFFLAGGICFGCLAILGSFLYYSQSSSINPPPIYEEIYSKSSDLKKKIRLADNALYKSFYSEGIAEKDIFFSSVAPKHKNGYYWDFTELLIRFPKENAALQLAEIIEFNMSELAPTVTYDRERISPDELVYYLFVQGYFTHKIRLIFHGDIEKPIKGPPKIAIIIDDLGYDFRLAMSFIRLDLPLSLSVLPIAPYTKHIVQAANHSKRELILHLPMEPNDYPNVNPGPGALLVNMNEKELRRLIKEHFNRITGLRGVNNHMGSLFSEKRDKMSVVLSEVKKANLFYVDSKTTNQSVGNELAEKMGIPTANRSIFLDHDLSPESIRFQMERLLSISRYTGDAIGIGHPHDVTREILMEYMHRLKNDFKVVYVSELAH